MSRKLAREMAVCFLFQVEFQKENIKEQVEDFIDSYGESNYDKDYFLEVINGVLNSQKEIDELIDTNAKDWSIDRICTVIRGSTYLQSQPECGYDTLRQFYAFTDMVDIAKGLKAKNKTAKKFSHRVPDVHSSMNINYMGREDWGSMTDYVERAHVICDGHLLFEILDVGENFCLSLMLMRKKTKYMDRFCQILEEEQIPYKVLGIFNNHLPISKLESAPQA